MLLKQLPKQRRDIHSSGNHRCCGPPQRPAVQSKEHQRAVCVAKRVQFRKAAGDFEIEDSGVGLAPDVMQRLFEPFVTTKSGGMGIGLSISRTIIRDHGGEIEATAAPGGGALFRVRLPATS